MVFTVHCIELILPKQKFFTENFWSAVKINPCRLSVMHNAYIVAKQYILLEDCLSK